MRKIPISLLLATAAALAGCSTGPFDSSWIHRIDVQQGNVVEQEMVDQLKPGMTKSQVRYLLGTPTLVDVFHTDRWDYTYSLTEGRDEREERRLTLVFSGDRLVSLEGDYRPMPRDEAEAPAPERVVNVPAEAIHPEEKGFLRGTWESVTGWSWGDDDEPAAEEPAPAENDTAQ